MGWGAACRDFGDAAQPQEEEQAQPNLPALQSQAGGLWIHLPTEQGPCPAPPPIPHSSWGHGGA